MPWLTRPLFAGHLLYMSVTMIRLGWLTKIIFQVFSDFFFLKLTGELALAYESYTDGILIVILNDILNDYLFYLALAGNNEPIRLTLFTSVG